MSQIVFLNIDDIRSSLDDLISESAPPVIFIHPRNISKIFDNFDAVFQNMLDGLETESDIPSWEYVGKNGATITIMPGFIPIEIGVVFY